MKIIFAGTPDFAVAPLKNIIDNGFEVVGVITQTDKPQGRKGILTPPPVKTKALELGLPVLQPHKIRESVDEVKKVKTELITTRRVIFIPAVSIKEVLAKTPIQITCYDRYGKIKKTVSEDEGKVEDDSTTYPLTVEASPAEGGTVEGSGTYSPGQMVEISAVAKSGYRFSAWNDGNTDANRSVTVTGDATYTATFVSTATGDDGDDDGGLAG